MDFTIDLRAGSIGGPVRFTLLPHDVPFKAPISLEIDASATDLSPSEGLILWDADGRWVSVPTTWRGSTAIAELEHFSDFGMGRCFPVEDDTQNGCRPVEPSLCPDESTSCLGIWVNGWTGSWCLAEGEYWFRDSDDDGLDDLCEEDLAYFFRPRLRASFDCSWDEGMDRIGGEYLHLAQRPAGLQPRGAPIIHLVYMPAFYVDCGSAFISTDHSGDSEFINAAVQFYPETNRWETRDVFLSAHCGTSTGDGRCQWWDATQITEWVDGRGLGAPTVFVSLEKHANYRSRQACEAGVLPVDSCPPNGPNYRFPVNWGGFNSRNIGSRKIPLIDRTVALSGSTLVSSTRTESMWLTVFDFQWEDPSFCGPQKISCRFNGWQEGVWGEGARPYGTHLQSFGF